MLHTKHWFALSSSMQHIFDIPIMKLRLDRWSRNRGQLPGGPTGDGETPVSSATWITGDRRQTKQFCFLDADCLVVGERQSSSRRSAGKYPVEPPRPEGDIQKLIHTGAGTLE